jgi:tripartite ATP-independent transporter DctP family solute receptor
MYRAILAILAAAAVGLSGVEATAQTINVRLAHGSPRGHPNNAQAQILAKDLERATNGRLKIAVFGDRQLGDDREIIQLVRAGTVDAGYASSVNFPLILGKVAFEALQLPGLVKSYDELARVLQSEPAIKMLDSLEADGLKGLCYSDGGHRHFLNRTGPVRRIADFKGLKTRIVPIPLFKAVWERLGANPVGIPYGEVYTAMQTRVIDAVEFNVSSIEADKVYETAKHITLTGHYFWPGFFFYNKAKFDALPADIRQIVLDTAGPKCTARFVAHTRDEEKLTIERLKAKGVAFYEFEERQKLLELMQPLYDDWAAKHPLIRDFINATRKL